MNRAILCVGAAFMCAGLCLRIAPAGEIVNSPADELSIAKAVPVLLANRLAGDGRARVDRVVSDGSEAVATWQSHAGGGIVVLRRHSNSWCLAGYADHDPTGPYLWGALMSVPPGSYDGGSGLPPPSAHDLTDRLGVNATFAQRVVEQLPELRGHWTPQPVATAVSQQAGHGTLLRSLGHVDILPLKGVDVAYSSSDGIGAELRLKYAGSHPSNAPTLTGHSSTGVVAQGKVMYEFVTTTSAAPAAISSGTLDIWFPCVIPDDRQYALQLGANGSPIIGTLHNNVLHFDLPKFELSPERAMKGTVLEGTLGRPDPMRLKLLNARVDAVAPA